MNRRVFVLGGTGTIGRATVRALVARGHEVVCLVRQRLRPRRVPGFADWTQALAGAELRFGDALVDQQQGRRGRRTIDVDVDAACHRVQ